MSNMENKIIDLIKILRISNGISQIEMAKVANMTISTYNIKETKKKSFRMSEVFSIFSKLDIFLEIDNRIIRENKDLISKIIITRNRKFITQDWLRQKLNISHPSYVKRENCQVSYTLTEVVNICQILDLKINVYYNKIENGQETLIRY
ncbi:MAG: helix-turn-helix domain-containing protein [Cetobacterium sp.]